MVERRAVQRTERLLENKVSIQEPTLITGSDSFPEKPFDRNRTVLSMTRMNFWLVEEVGYPGAVRVSSRSETRAGTGRWEICIRPG